MLKNKHSVLLQDIRLKYYLRNVSQLVQRIWRVGKHHIERAGTALQILEHISMDWQPCPVIQFVCHLGNELIVLEVLFDSHNLLTPTRHKFQSNTSCSAKKVQSLNLTILEVEIYIRQDIKQILFSEIRGRTCLECPWHSKMLSLVLSAYNPHTSIIN